MISEKQLPCNIEAEQAVLGSILIEPACYDLVADRLTAEDFYRDAHRSIYEAFTALACQRIAIDFVTVCHELECKDRLEDVGGSASITSLLNHLPTSGNIEHYAAIVARTAIMRRLIHAAGRVAAIAYQQDDHAVEEAERAIAEATSQHASRDFSTAAEVVSEHYHDLETLRDHQLVGITTGFRELDHCLGGMQRSDLLILAARPGVGKSSLMLSMVHRAVYGPAAARVAIFSLEMSKKQLVQRLLSFESHIDLYRLRNAHIAAEEWEQLTLAHGNLATDRLVLDDTGGISITQLRSRARRLQAQWGGLDLIVVDYLQLVHAEAGGNRSRNREQEVAEISRSLKELAKELNVPVLALAQLSRAVEGRADKRPQLSDLRESGGIENDADVVMLLYREDYYRATGEGDGKPTGKADLIVAKQRNGPVGTIGLHFIAAETRFAEEVPVWVSGE